MCEVCKQPVVAGGQIWRIGVGYRSNLKSNSCNFVNIVINLSHGALSW